MSESIVEIIVREFFWIGLVFSILVGFDTPTGIKFDGETYYWRNKWIRDYILDTVDIIC